MVEFIKAYGSKLSSNRINDYIGYLGGSNAITPIPESFLKKVRDIRSVLTVSESKNNIIDLLEL